MKEKAFVVGIILLCHQVCFGQQDHKTDSLLQVLTFSQDDTNKVHTLLALCQRFMDLGKVDEHSLQYAEEVQALSEKLEFEKGLAGTYNVKGGLWRLKRDFDIALTNYNKAEKISHTIGWTKGVAISHNGRGNIHYDQGNHQEALFHYHQALHLFEDMQDPVEIPLTLFRIGNVHYLMGNYTKSDSVNLISLRMAKVSGNRKLQSILYNTLGATASNQSRSGDAMAYYEASLEIKKELKDKRGMASTLGNIGNIHRNQGQYKEALEKYEQALQMMEELGDKKGIMLNYHNIGLMHSNQAGYEQALFFLNKALSLATEINSKSMVLSCYNHIGGIYYKLNRYAEALEMFESGLTLSQETGDQLGMTTIQGSISIVHQALGNYSEAIKPLNSVLEIQKQMGNLRGQAGTYNSIGGIYEKQGNYSDALKYLLKGMEINQQIQNKFDLAADYLDVGNIYYQQGHYEEALKNYQVAEEISHMLENKDILAHTYDAKASVYIAQGKDSVALAYYHKSVDLFLKLQSNNGLAHAYIGIGHIYKHRSENLKALEYYLLSLAAAREIGDKEQIAQALLHSGSSYVALADPDKALKNLHEGLAIAREIGAKAIIYECYLHLSSLNSVLRNSDAALEYFKLYTHYKDSVFNVKSNRTLAELQTRYESDRKDKEIAFLENESKINMLELKVKAESFIRLTAEKERVQALNLYQSQKIHFLANEKQLHEYEIEQNESNLAIQKAESERKQGELDLMAKEDEIQKLIIKKQQQTKNNLLASLGFVCFCSLMGYAYYMTRQQLRLQKLRNKIASDLHDDVGSTLSSIYLFSEMARQQSKEVMPMLDTISESSKKMLDAMADIVWTIHPENDELEKIILRMRSFAYELLRTKQMDFEFNADENLHSLKLSMEVRKNLYLIFKEATNNMVKYSQADYAHFSLSESNRQLTMEIKDNGKGFEMSTLSTGNGLRNMKKRAEEIGGKLRIESGMNKGTRIQLSVSV